MGAVSVGRQARSAASGPPVGAAAGGISELELVEIVRIDCTVRVPGVNVGGLNEQVACGGTLPHVSAISLRYGPPCGVTVTVYFADWPADTVAPPGDTLIAKS